jgi:hypothetical protein
MKKSPWLINLGDENDEFAFSQATAHRLQRP